MMTSLMDIQGKNRQVVEQKLNNHLEKVKSLFEVYAQTTKRELAQAYQKQDSQMRNAEQAISEQLDKLCNDEISLQSLLQNDEQFLVYMTHMVDELYNKTVKFVPKCNLDEMIVTLKLRESVFEKISDALSESHEL